MEWNCIYYHLISANADPIHKFAHLADIKVPNIQSVHKIDALFVMQCTALRLGFESALEN